MRGMSAVCVTYGVGCFSLINAVVGSYAERVPMVVISCAPKSFVRHSSLILHHTTGDYNLLFSMMEKVTLAVEILVDASQAAAQIDRFDCSQGLIRLRRALNQMGKS